MGYRNLQETVIALEHTGQLQRIDADLDAHLEVGAVQRRVYRNGGPALLFTRVRGSTFPLLGNLFGTLERARYLFRDTLDAIQSLAQAKGDPAATWRPGQGLDASRTTTRARLAACRASSSSSTFERPSQARW